eukprot:5380292-Alexandrium_andersonii.AAC.1
MFVTRCGLATQHLEEVCGVQRGVRGFSLNAKSESVCMCACLSYSTAFAMQELALAMGMRA